MPVCSNFVCAFSRTDKGKVYCTYSDTGYDVLTDCTASMNNFCKRYKYFSCKICGHDTHCFNQREKGLFYSAEKGSYIPSSTTDFAKAVKQNELVNAHHDIIKTAVGNYCMGYKTTTTVKQLYEKYGNKFPYFDKKYIQNTVERSILMYLEYENKK